MKEEKLSKYRSEVIEKFINIEWIINAIISQYYFRKVLQPFVLGVLYDEYFSFGLRRRVLEKIIPSLDKSKIEDLNRLNTIRNYFAHCNQQIFKVFKGSKPEEGFVPDPKNTKKAIDFEKLYTEFVSKEKEVTKYLFGIYKDIGGIALSMSEAA